MAQPDASLSTVEEWKKKACDIWIHSNDSFALLSMKVFDAGSIMLKSSEHCDIQRSLESLESERSICFRFEKNKDPSVRYLMFGIIETLHLTILHLMKDGMSSEASLSIVEEWKRKAFEFSIKSDDSIVSLIMRGFDVMTFILKNSEHMIIQRAMETLESERLVCLRYERINEQSIRSLMFGIIQSLHLTLLFLTEKRTETTLQRENNSLEPIPIPLNSLYSSYLNSTDALDQLSTIPTFTTTFQLKKEPVQFTELIHRDNEKSTVGFIGDDMKKEEVMNYDMPSNPDFIGNEIKEEESHKRREDEESLDQLSTIPTFTSPVRSDPKEEPVDYSQSNENEAVIKDEPIDFPLLDQGNDIGNLDQMGDDLIENEAGEETNDTGKKNVNVDDCEDGEEEEDANKADDISKESSETELVNRRRSSRIATSFVKYAESMEESDDEDEEEPSLKKKRSESVETNDKIVHQNRRSSDRGPYKPNEKYMEKKELECPECEYRSRSAHAWEQHLRLKHFTTPTLAGCLLRCDCGNESYSAQHIRECDISNFIIIRTGDGTIRRFTDTVTTPQCVLCEVHPKTPYGYTQHLRIHHKSTLLANGIYILCSCGTRYNTDHDQKKHDNKCNGRDYSLHKRDED